jgi:hypothetical protein
MSLLDAWRVLRRIGCVKERVHAPSRVVIAVAFTLRRLQFSNSAYLSVPFDWFDPSLHGYAADSIANACEFDY